MTPADALAELAAMSPRAAELVEIVRKGQRGGRPPRRELDPAARRLEVMRLVLAALRAEPTHILSRSQLLTVCRNICNAKVLVAALFDLDVSNEIRSQTSAGPNGGRPLTVYQLLDVNKC